MELSKHNIISKIVDTEDYFIVNLLSQQADILSSEQYELIMKEEYPDQNQLIEKGYLVEADVEKRMFRDKYLNFIDSRDSDEVQLFFVPGYECNFACSYCYQDEYTYENEILGNKEIRAFFHYIELQFADRQKYITIFGGEPLLNSRKKREQLEFFIEEANSRKLDIAIVTNGYHLSSFIDILKRASIREIQVTLDGVKDAHNIRRPLKNGEATFDTIVEGIDLALQADMPINLRMIVDKTNIDELKNLANFSIEKGWTKNLLFKTQLGRNYELHHCQKESNTLYNRIELYQEIYKIVKENPEVLEFYKPAFSISRFLFENGELPDPLFDSCPATKTEWAFDYTGKIYSCTATVGKPGEQLGTFFPTMSLDEEKVEAWEERDVLSIRECRECAVQLACGGGCGSVAKNTNGRICSPDCRPVKEQIELGMSLYSEN